MSFRKDCDNGLFELAFEVLKAEISDEIVGVEVKGPFLTEGIGNFDFEEVSDPFRKRMAIFSPEPERLVFT